MQKFKVHILRMVPDHAIVEAPDAQEAVAMVARGDFVEYHRWEPGESISESKKDSLYSF